jgi:hypothetical protein
MKIENPEPSKEKKIDKDPVSQAVDLKKKPETLEEIKERIKTGPKLTDRMPKKPKIAKFGKPG